MRTFILLKLNTFYFFMATPTACGDATSINPLHLMGNQAHVSTATWAIAVRYLTHCATAATPKNIQILKRNYYSVLYTKLLDTNRETLYYIILYMIPIQKHYIQTMCVCSYIFFYIYIPDPKREKKMKWMDSDLKSQ